MKDGGNSRSYKQILIFEAVTIDRLEDPISEHGLLSTGRKQTLPPVPLWLAKGGIRHHMIGPIVQTQTEVTALDPLIRFSKAISARNFDAHMNCLMTRWKVEPLYP